MILGGRGEREGWLFLITLRETWGQERDHIFFKGLKL